uniref:Secreted protein n=1 Tax=Onchocerca volvulus TaxID=6282 RepID=A0A8R1TLK3_ONCVO
MQSHLLFIIYILQCFSLNLAIPFGRITSRAMAPLTAFIHNVNFLEKKRLLFFRIVKKYYIFQQSYAVIIGAKF